MDLPEMILSVLREVGRGGESIDADTELLESGILDSLALILLFEALQDAGYPLQPTQLRREQLKTARDIAEAASGLL